MSSAKMPVWSERAAGAGGGGLLSAALQQAVLEEVAQAVGARVLETVGRQLEERVQYVLGALQQSVRAVEEQVAALQATGERMMQRFGDDVKQGKRAFKELERRVAQLELAQAERAREKDVAKELSGRMERLEASLQSAPSNTKALLAQTPRSNASGPLPATSTASAPPSTAPPSTAPPSTAPPSTAPPSTAPPPSSGRSQSPATRDRLGRDVLKAAEEGSAERVRELLDAGADIHARDEDAFTPLHRAADRGHVDVVSLLLDRGADIYTLDWDGDTVLHTACGKDLSGRCVSRLLLAGADIECLNDQDWTPLHSAASNGNEAAVRALLVAGADRTAENSHGQTPLELCEWEDVRPPPRELTPAGCS